MSEDGEARFREPKTVYDQRDWVEKVIPSSTKYKNKWAVAIFDEWQISRSVIAPVLDPGGLFKGYDLHKVTQLSTSTEEIDAVTDNLTNNRRLFNCDNRRIETHQYYCGLASLWWRWPRSRGREISTEDHLWNSLWYPTLSRLVISNNIQVIFGIVVNDVFINEKCSLKCKCLIWDQNHVWSQIKTHKIFIWAFIGYQGLCMWPKYASFIGCCPHEWIMSLRTTFENELIYYQQITSNACQQSGRGLKKGPQKGLLTLQYKNYCYRI